MKIAIISGASSGIGREFCKQLDSQNFDEVWAFALDEEGLLSLQAELKTKVKIFAGDLTKNDVFEKLNENLKKEKPNVLWLVNCSGFGKFGRYDEIEMNTSLNMIELNCKSLVKMTETILPYMNDGARIINVASVAAFQSVPYANVYAATKTFVLSYSRGLNEELKHRKISITAVCPFWTKTQFFKRAVNPENERIKKYVVMYEADKVVKKAIKDGIKRKQVSIYGFIARSQTRLVKLLPHKWIMRIWQNQQKFK